MLRLLGVTGSALVISISGAHAGSFGLNEYGATGTGMALAGGAAGGAGLASIVFNPATLTDFAGMWSSQTFTFVGPSVGVNSSVYGDTGDMANGGRLVPAAQMTYQFNDKLWFGLTIDSPFGLVTNIYPYSYESFFGLWTTVLDIDATPTISYKVNEWLSVGAGVQVNYFKAELSNNLTPLVPGSFFLLNGHDISPGYKLGATVKPFAGTEIGVGYRSQLKPNISGTLLNTIPLPGLSGLIPAGQQHMNLGLILPDQINVGIRQVITDDVTLMATYQWTNWSVFNRFIVNSDAGPALPLNFYYKDGWLMSIGGEYKFNSNTTLRAGTGFERSPINDLNRTVRLPDTDRIFLSVGGSYQFTPQLTVDAAYEHVFGRNEPVNMTNSANPEFNGIPFVGETKPDVNIFSLTLNYRWDAPPAAAVVAKY